MTQGTPLPCPTWCNAHQSDPVDTADPGYHERNYLWTDEVRVAITSDTQSPEHVLANVHVSGQDLMTADQVRELAQALLAVADQIDALGLYCGAQS